MQEAEATHWYLKSVAETAAALNTDPENGLAPSLVQQRLASAGQNEIIEDAQRSTLQMFLDQFRDFMIIVLVMAAAVSGLVGELVDTIAILTIVLLNAIFGTVQQYRAMRAIAALRKMSEPETLVVRDGRPRVVAANQIVVGDLVQLAAGDVVPADLRFSECFDLELDESALTGEALTVAKNAATLAQPDLSLGDQHNMACKGTVVTRGRGSGMVVAIGMATELGKIAVLLREQEDDKTPLQRRLATFGARLSIIILAVCLLIFVAGMLRNEPPLLMFLTAVSLAVAAVPEALPAIVTISLALGARLMSSHNALLRNLPATETLGSVTYICSDKTGTLTQNRMHAEKFWVDGDLQDSIPPGLAESTLGQRFVQVLALCNDVATSQIDDGEGDEQHPARDASADPTELALCVAAEEAGYAKSQLARELRRVGEITFTAERKRMTTLHQETDHCVGYTKGAPETVLPLCAKQLRSHGSQPFDPEVALTVADELAAQGYRVLAIACRDWPRLPPLDAPAEAETDLTFLGLVALLDPPRDEAGAAVADCLAAGITPVMITGDHPQTALAIATRLGIADESRRVVTGPELARMSLPDLADNVTSIRVYARVDPEQKTRIVEALQARGEFVAMTGDGVNDAPALKRADIGVAMGLRGTDVAREASDMILVDDNFATIVAAIREGRRIFDNVLKFIKYTMTSNTGEIVTLLVAPFLGLPIPLLPIHLLWINLVTDGLPGLALSSEPAERDIMVRPPRPPGMSAFAGGRWQYMVCVGLLIGGLSIGAQAWSYHGGSDNWQTMVFTVLTLSQLVNVLMIRSDTRSLFTLGLFTNLPLIGTVVMTVCLQLAVIYLPLCNAIFKTRPLSLTELGICFGLAMVVLIAVESVKLVIRIKK